jgi:MFS family permease
VPAPTVTNRSAIRRLAAARLVTMTGSWAASIAMAYVLYQRTGSAVWLSALYLLTFGVMGFVNPFAGALADKVDRRRLMIASELLGSLAWGALVFVQAPWLMLVFAFLGALAHSPFPAASGAAIPNLASQDDLSWANSLISLGRSVGSTAGPALGGLLVAVAGGPFVFGLNALSFLVSALLIVLASGEYASGSHGEEGEFRGLGAGLRHVVASSILLPILGGSTIMWFALNIAIPADAPLAKQFGVGSLGFGLIDTAFGVGAIVGAVLARRLTPRLEPVVLLAGAVGVAIGWGMIGLTPFFALILVGSLLASLVDSVGMVASDNLVQRLTPDAIRGRVFALIMTAGCLVSVIAFAGAGFLIEALGPQGAYLLGGATALVGGVVMVPGLLRLRGSLPGEPEPATET